MNNGTADFMIVLAGTGESVRVARRSVRSFLHDFAPREAIDNALLVVSEFATNAVLHGAATFTVSAWLQVYGGRLRLEVHDAGRTTRSPVTDPDDTGAQWGLGMVLAAAVSREMGHDLDADGSLMWAELRWPPLG